LGSAEDDEIEEDLGDNNEYSEEMDCENEWEDRNYALNQGNKIDSGDNDDADEYEGSIDEKYKNNVKKYKYR
jgi:hypothetical protein